MQWSTFFEQLRESWILVVLAIALAAAVATLLIRLVTKEKANLFPMTAWDRIQAIPMQEMRTADASRSSERSSVTFSYKKLSITYSQDSIGEVIKVELKGFEPLIIHYEQNWLTKVYCGRQDYLPGEMIRPHQDALDSIRAYVRSMTGFYKS